jgi:high affinity sulfate transporter 1
METPDNKSVANNARGEQRVTVGKMLPIANWLPRYRLEWLAWDAIAGCTLAFYAIPVSLAYASLAGLPPHYGIYCYLVGGLAYAIFGTSKQLAIGPTSAIAMLVGASILNLASGDAERAAEIASLAACVVAALAVVSWLLRLSSLVNFISETILVGFKAGAAMTIALTQLPKLFGVPGGGDHFFERLYLLAGQLGDTNWVVLTTGLCTLTLLLAGDRLFPGRPVALFVLTLAITATIVFHLERYGVGVVGAIPAGLPDLAWPSLRLRDVDGVLPLAAACFLLSYVEGVAAARALAAKHGEAINPRQELLGLGAANFAAAFVHGFPVAGGLSQSAVNDKAGAKSPLALVFASITIGLCLLFFSGLLYNLPSVCLAAIVLVAVKGLFDVAALRHLWRVSRFEFRIAMVALVGVLLLGILKGVLLAVIVSLAMLLAAAARPHVAVLGRIPGTQRFSDSARHADNEQFPGVLIVRVESSLLYFNAEYVRDTIWNHAASSPGIRVVICDLSNAPHVDVSGAKMLKGLVGGLQSSGSQLRIVEARSTIRDLLRAEGVEDQIGYLGRHISIGQAVSESSQFTTC